MVTVADVQSQRKRDPTMDAMFRRAERMLESPSTPRKHHIVPSSYLIRWTGGRNLIRMTDATSRRSVLIPPRKALRITDFYRLESPDLEPGLIPPLLMEMMLGEIEGAAKSIVDQLVSGGRCDDPDDMAQLAWYMALQLTRGEGIRAEQAALATQSMQLYMSHLTDENIREFARINGRPAEDEDVAQHRRFADRVVAGEIDFAPQDAAAAAMSAQLASEIGKYLLQREWLVYRAPHGGLITCDEPVVLVPAPGHDRRRRAGVATAGAVVIALDPSTLLVMFHPKCRPIGIGRIPDLLPKEVAEINREVAANSYRWLVEEPSRGVTLAVPLPPRARAFEQRGPLPGLKTPALVYENFKPTRWAYSASPPPLPVSRWWA